MGHILNHTKHSQTYGNTGKKRKERKGKKKKEREQERKEGRKKRRKERKTVTVLPSNRETSHLLGVRDGGEMYFLWYTLLHL